MTLTVHIRRLATRDHTLVQDLHLDVPAGRILTLMGPSGSGKSSVLAAMAGTLHSVAEGSEALRFEGTVTLDGTLPRGLGRPGGECGPVRFAVCKVSPGRARMRHDEGAVRPTGHALRRDRTGYRF